MYFRMCDSMVHFWQYGDDLFKTINDLGYDTYARCLYDLYYRKKQSFRQIKESLEYQRSENSIRVVFNKFGWPVRSRGGPNFNGKRPHEICLDEIKKDILTTAETAVVLNLTHTYLNKLCRTGKGPKYLTIKNRHFFIVKDVHRYSILSEREGKWL